MSTEVFPAVTGYENGANLEPEIMNRPILQLRTRTDYLKNKLDYIIGQGLMASVRITDIPLSSNQDKRPALYDFVTIDKDTNTLIKAQAGTAVYPITPYESTSLESYSLGIVTNISGNFATVVLYGDTKELIGLNVSQLLETGETFRSGPYYLSAKEPGKITSKSKGSVVYLGMFIADSNNKIIRALLAPFIKDYWEAHLHDYSILAGIPAGDIREETSGTDSYKVVAGFLPDTGTGKLRIKLFGSVLSDENITYTFTLASTDGTLETTTLSWQTSDGSSNGNIAIGRLNTLYKLGDTPIYIMIELDKDYASVENSDANAIDSAAFTYTYTKVIPRDVKGWIQRQYNITADRLTGTSNIGLVVFGYYLNSQEKAYDILKFIASVGTQTDITIKDIDDNTVNTLSNISLDTIYKIDTAKYNLYCYFTDRDKSGTASGDTIADADSWQITLDDDAPGAIYEYNIGFDYALNQIYPPIPLNSAVLEVNGVAQAKISEFESGTGCYKLTHSNIYWYTTGDDDTPFPPDWTGFSGLPYEETARAIRLYYSIMRLGETGLVNELKAGNNIIIRNAKTGKEASTGGLEISASVISKIEDKNQAGAQVVKTIDEKGTALRGPVVERIRVNGNLALTSTLEDGQGVVTISSVDAATYGQFSDIILRNAKQELIPDNLISYIKLLGWDSSISSNINSAFVCKFKVPYTLTGKYKVLFYFTVFGLSDVDAAKGIDYAGLKLTYSVLQDFTVSGSAPELIIKNLLSDVMTNEINYDLPFGRVSAGYTAYDPVVMHNDNSIALVEGQVLNPFSSALPLDTDSIPTVTAGDIISIKIARQGMTGSNLSHEYTGELGFLDFKWRLISAL